MFQTLPSISFGEPNPTTSHLPLVSSSLPIWLLTIGYLWFVLSAGPAFMKRRPAYNLKQLILVYNLLQIIANLYVFLHSVFMVLRHTSIITNYGCIESFESSHPLGNGMTTTFYAYYLLKVVDYLDTVFFVLRKSQKQISFLHVYHHVLMALFVHYYFRFYGAGGQYFNTLLLNSLIHVVMYSYYFITALRPNMRGINVWKKQITRMQLLQFALILCHHSYPLLFRSNCKFPRALSIFGVVQTIVMIVLFGNFYWKSYLRPRTKGSEETKLDPKDIKMQ